MKSPVFGARAGNVKCKGKKTKLMSCLCCEMIDFRCSQRIKQANKEIRDETQIKTDRART